LKPDADLTSLDKADIHLIGRSRGVANMGIGQITLDPIEVNVSTSLDGLQGLKLGQRSRVWMCKVAIKMLFNLPSMVTSI
jgi:hypothetical protein